MSAGKHIGIYIGKDDAYIKAWLKTIEHQGHSRALWFAALLVAYKKGVQLKTGTPAPDFLQENPNTDSLEAGMPPGEGATECGESSDCSETEYNFVWEDIDEPVDENSANNDKNVLLFDFSDFNCADDRNDGERADSNQRPSQSFNNSLRLSKNQNRRYPAEIKIKEGISAYNYLRRKGYAPAKVIKQMIRRGQCEGLPDVSEAKELLADGRLYRFFEDE